MVPQTSRVRDTNHQGTVKEPSPACSQANGAARKGVHPEGTKILDAFYESRKQSGQPLPVPRNWAEATRIIGKFIEAGYASTRILEALEIAPAIATNCMNIALDRLAKSDPVSPFTVGGRDPHGDQDHYDPTVDIDPDDPHRRDERSW